MSNTIKKLLTSALFAIAVCCVLVPSAAWASSADPEVRLESKGESVAAAIVLPEGVTVDDTRSLQVSLRVSVASGAVGDIGFAFADTLKAGVAEYRYRAEDGLLTLYVSGNQNLLAQSALDLGKVVVSAADEAGVRVGVQVVPQSLKMVNGSHIESIPEFYADETPAEAVVGNGGVTPGPGPGPGEGGDGGDTGSGGNSGTGGNGGGSGSGGSDAGLDTTGSDGASGPEGIAKLLNTGDAGTGAIIVGLVVACCAAILLTVAYRRSRR